MFSKFLTATTVALAASLASAQTYTACDPTKKDCPPDPAVGAKIVEIDFRKGANSFFKNADGTTLKYDKDLGAVFSISKETDAPTIGSNAYIFFGQVDVTVRASQGVGVVTSFVLQSDDLDEIDWEWLGGDATQVQTNYFSKGCTEVYDRGGFSPVADPINQFHTYTIKWTPEQLDWIIDGNVVRTLKNTGVDGCSGYPQTPMQIKLGTWVAGRKDAPQGTIEWAGGLTDFSKAPFDGYYQNVKIQDFMGGKGATGATEYVYGDRSGHWQSIKVINDGSETKPSSTSSSAKTTSTSASSKSTASSTATTLTTVTSSSASASQTTNSAGSKGNTTSGSGDSGASETSTGTSSTAASSVSTAPTGVATGAAGKVGGNLAAAGAAALLGYLVL
ncbi:glycoside hydrolase family 16 protein [Chaetomium strumarium]|uniref:Crh-like protein n=1 Tax=Chaetomium strumarium TaxID=1170767 RepID=A0AAJ0GNV7_9PEZI|nr:glycoside hydrolase family 16 protein [Chaetomium strumarium]